MHWFNFESIQNTNMLQLGGNELISCVRDLTQDDQLRVGSKKENMLRKLLFLSAFSCVTIFGAKPLLKAGERKERPLVDPNVEVTLWESCSEYPDGTPCEKRCIDITCDHRMARCYKVNHEMQKSLKNYFSRVNVREQVTTHV